MDNYTNLGSLTARWEARSKQASDMMNVNCELKIVLLSVSSLKLYLSDIFLQVETVACSIIVLNGTHHVDETIRTFSKHYTNFSIYCEKG